MQVYTATEQAYKNGYTKGYEDGLAKCEELKKKIKALEKSNRNWRRKVQRLRNKEN